MKKVLLLVVVGFVLSFLPGCDLDDDEDFYLDNAWVGFGLVQKEGSESMTILMDDGEVLYPVSDVWSELKDNDRVVTNFTILGNRDNEDHDEQYYVRINSIRKILFKGIIEINPAIEDSIGNDPIKVKDCWIKKNLLNFDLRYYGGEKVHFINLVEQPGAAPADGPILLELRHNDNEDKAGYSLSGVVTFDLASLKVEGKDSVQIKVTAKDFNNQPFEYTGYYKY